MEAHVERRSVKSEEVQLAHHPIPEMTDPGAYWKQPDRLAITVDATHALMSKETFEELNEYSCSNPSGVYPGKMWSRHNGAFDRQFLAQGGTPEWLLCWFDFSERGPAWCVTKSRKILIAG